MTVVLRRWGIPSIESHNTWATFWGNQDDTISNYELQNVPKYDPKHVRKLKKKKKHVYLKGSDVQKCANVLIDPLQKRGAPRALK